jgi:Tfp pilus assembly protein PilO
MKSSSNLTTLLARRKIELSCLAGFVLGAIALYFVGIEPMQAQHGQYELQLEQVHQQRVESAELQGEKRRLELQLEEVRKRLAACPMQLQSYDQINIRVAKINEMACSEELVVEEIELGRVRGFDRYQSVPILVKGRGTYPEVLSVLRQIRGAYPDTALTHLKIRGDAGKTPFAPAFEMQLVWYAARSADDSNPREQP